MFLLNIKNKEPIYNQIELKIKELIFNGTLNTNEQLPTIRELAQQLKVTPNTVQRAYQVLENQKYIYSITRKGYFVENRSADIDAQTKKKIKKELINILNEAMFIGMSPVHIESMIVQILNEV